MATIQNMARAQRGMNWHCVSGHDLCGQMYPGPDCPYCERIIPSARTQARARPRKRAAPKISETAEHLTIAHYLIKLGLGGTALMFHLRNERVGHNQRAIAAKMGVMSSLPDWCVVDGGQVGFIELKKRGWVKRTTKTGTFTPHELKQLAMHKRLRLAGAWVEVCETLDEVLAVLVRYGVPLRKDSLTVERIRRGFSEGAQP